MSTHPPARVLLTKIGLDGHDRSVRVLARALREAGMDVIYLGPWAETPDVVAAAVQEDVDVVGVSSLAYDHLLVPDLMRELRAADFRGDVLVGGTIQSEDLALLDRVGVARTFHPGEPLSEIVEFIRACVDTKRTHDHHV